MRDPYEILGVSRTADEKEIKSAYRKLAKRLHPDLNPGDKAIEEKFKEVAAAYDLLGDADKRKRFDAGEIDASGAEQAPRGYYRDFTDQPGAGKYSRQEGFTRDVDLEDFLSGIFRKRGGAGAQGADFKARGSDVAYSLRIDFMDAVKGARKTVTMPDGRALNVTIPEGVTDRQTLRLAGQGNPGYGGGPSGDAFIEIHIQPHGFFTRKDNDIHLELPVTLSEALLGGKIEVPTINGPVVMNIPKNANSGTMLRLKEKGVLDRRSKEYGHQYVTLKVMLPEAPDPALEAFVAGWTPSPDYNPRLKMGVKA